MESLNHDMNDIDALLRKAAKGYPLKAGDGDWENISGKLLTTPEAVSPTKKNKRGKYFGLIILFFLIAGGSMFYFKFQYDNTDEIQIGNNGNILNKSTSPTTSESQKPVLKARGNDQSNHIKPLQIIGEKSGMGSLGKQIMFLENSKENNSAHGFIRSVDQVVTQKLTSPPSPILPGENISGFESTLLLPRLRIEDTVKSLADTLTHSKDNKNVFANQNYKRLYFGLTGGPDFSNVKSQAVNKAGYNLGLLAGYRFNRNISVESGILWSKKKYYSDGKYFSMNKVGPSMPSNMKIVTVDGQLTLLEIPLKLKFDFAHNKKSNLFISTGISANICLRERNNYLTEMNGLQEYHIGLYKDVLYCPISLISISAGYEYGLGKSRTLRLEPYIKIPLKKVGMGSMPVFSTGINVGILNLFSKERP